MASLTLLDQSLKTAAENLALDDALLEEVESGRFRGDLLRFWESPELAVVLGISGKVQDEIYLEECQAAKIPLLRRSSGGGTVLIGPGCLNYSLILRYENWPDYQDLTQSYKDILNKLAKALGEDCALAGTSDLIRGKQEKFSGNAQRRLKNAFLHHGTLLYNFDLTVMKHYLKEPLKQPDYRGKRPHDTFVRNIHLSSERMKKEITSEFRAELKWSGKLPDLELILVEKYHSSDWNLRR